VGAVDFVGLFRYNNAMENHKKRGGRPPLSSGQRQSEYLDVRLKVAEKKAFQDAAGLAGLPLATWVRERLRWASVKELQAAAMPIAFLETQERQ
jgi:hypothetical protein